MGEFTVKAESSDENDPTYSNDSENENEAPEENDQENKTNQEANESTEPKPSTSNVQKISDKNNVFKPWKDLGVIDLLCKACLQLNWNEPSKIQREVIPLALQGRDIIALAETGSGKTGAFAVPLVQSLLANPQRYFALVLTPTRELAFQISEQFEALGASIGLKCAIIVGGMDMKTQSLLLNKKPHILIATPGRLVDHLTNTKGFNLTQIKYLVMDEADRLLNNDFEEEIRKILKVVPRERRTYLFSATMTKKVEKLQIAALKDPARIEVSMKFQTVDKLEQFYMFIPFKYKDVYLVYLLHEMTQNDTGKSFIVFCRTCNNTIRIALLLRQLGFAAIPLHGQMAQNKRLGALTKFKSKKHSILLSTDVASRGLDIPHVDVVINFDVPLHSKDYIHRVGRTARAGRSGTAITLTTQYDVEIYLKIEGLINKKLEKYNVAEDEVMVFQERVMEAQRRAEEDMQNVKDHKKGTKRKHEDTEDVAEITSKKKIYKGQKSGGKKRSKGKQKRKR